MKVAGQTHLAFGGPRLLKPLHQVEEIEAFRQALGYDLPDNQIVRAHRGNVEREQSSRQVLPPGAQGLARSR